jgi:hypothetical protein
LRRKRSKAKRFFAAFLVIILLIILIFLAGFGIYKLSSWIMTFFKPPVENEALYKSPAYEEILYSRGKDGIWIADSVGKNIRQVTTNEDYAPSWNEDGTAFYFLRKNNDNTVNLLKFDYSNMKLESNPIQTFSHLLFPGIQNCFIKISEDCTKIAVSSFDWGINLIEVKTRKIISNSFNDSWKYFDIYSRNSKYFLFSEYDPYNLNFISGIEKRTQHSVLYFAKTDLLDIKNIDSSTQEFKGYSFSRNSYTFAYSKEGSIFYVDSIETIKPLKITDGVYPAIKPSGKSKYSIQKPFWVKFGFINTTGLINFESFGKKFILAATPHEICSIDIPLKRVSFVIDNKTKGTYLGWKLIDFKLADINNNNEKELIASWWAGGDSNGAERISIFKLEKDSRLTEIFYSADKFKNRIEIIDLDANGLNDLLNVYNDFQASEDSAMNALIWEDVYTWSGNKYVYSNKNYRNVYLELADTYRSFLEKAYDSPDKYGKGLQIIRNLLDRVEKLISK